MGGRGSRSSAGAFQILNGGVTIQPTLQAAQSANNARFKNFDPNGYHDLYNGRQYFVDQNLTIDQQIAAVNYLSNTPEAGSMYSMSQNMNHALATGQPLTANQQYVYNQMNSAMHNLGYNVNLTRYDHATMANDLLAKAGLTKSYENYSEAQLKTALVGMTYGEKKLVSASYNDFKNAPSSSKAVFDSRAVKINYKAKASTQAMMPGNGPGGALGEIVMADSKGRQNYKILDVRFNGKSARRQGTQSYSLPQVEFDVEVD